MPFEGDCQAFPPHIMTNLAYYDEPCMCNRKLQEVVMNQVVFNNSNKPGFDKFDDLKEDIAERYKCDKDTEALRCWLLIDEDHLNIQSEDGMKEGVEKSRSYAIGNVTRQKKPQEVTRGILLPAEVDVGGRSWSGGQEGAGGKGRGGGGGGGRVGKRGRWRVGVLKESHCMPEIHHYCPLLPHFFRLPTTATTGP